MPLPERVFVGLGSNLGGRLKMLEAALAALGALEEVTVTARSSLYLTEPVGYNEQGDFINAVVELRTSLEPRELLEKLKGIERALGRVEPPVRWGPRVIDLDILLFGRRVVRGPGLTVPHPELHRRRFALAPLAEIAPEARHPLLQATATELLAALRDGPEVKRIGSWS